MIKKEKTTKTIYIFQIFSISLIWIFVFGITVWILRLLINSINFRDAIDASVGISIVVIPIFIALASILTYVFIGLHRNRSEKEFKSGGKE